MSSVEQLLQAAIADATVVLQKSVGLAPALQRLAEAVESCWRQRGKVLIAGNGGSAADAMHFAEELVVRYKKNRQALAAIALCDPTMITCAGNDFGYDTIFERQIEALGNPGDVFIAFTTSGNSTNMLRALARAQEQGLVTVTFLGKGGGKARGVADIELIVPTEETGRIQEVHKLLFHTLCEWIDARCAAWISDSSIRLAKSA